MKKNTSTPILINTLAFGHMVIMLKLLPAMAPWLSMAAQIPTLNPGGIHISTAEIYQQVEKFNEIIDCLVTSQHWEDDKRIVLFVILREGVLLTKALHENIQTTIRQNLSPRDVPEKIIAVPDLPRTKSGKIVELAVKKIINGDTVNNLTSLENPEIFNYFQNRRRFFAWPFRRRWSI